MSTSDNPTAIANQAIDQAGLGFTIGDIEDGTRAAQTCLRYYTDTVRALLRTAHWDFARRETELFLLADASGNTPLVGNIVPSGFMYMYAYPYDCAKLRFIPRDPFGQPPIPPGNIVPPDNGAPIIQPLGMPPRTGRRMQPARFVISNTPNYIPPNIADNPTGMRGESPTGRVVILTDVKDAKGVYTVEAMYPNMWDVQFRAAVISVLAAWIAMPLADDKKMGLKMRDENVRIAQQVVRSARDTNGNESWTSSDIVVDWMQARRAGGFWRGYGGFSAGSLDGCSIAGWDALALPGGTVF